MEKIKNLKLYKKLYKVKFLRNLWGNYVFINNYILFHINKKILINYYFKKVFKRNLDWDNPQNLIEKIYWLLFNTNTTLWTKLADKYQAREYVIEKGFGDLLNDLLFYDTTADNIPFKSLPQSFVIKTNNACETIIIIKDKSTINQKKIINQLNKWLKKPYGIMLSQIHYLKIPPKIIIEKYLLSDQCESLIDYKIWCFNGNPECILVVSDRNHLTHTYSLNLFDLNWKSIDNHLCSNIGQKKIPKPQSLELMLKACKSLSKDISQVRIDFYDINSKPVFGEFTFTTGFGYFTNEYYNYLGSKVVI